MAQRNLAVEAGEDIEPQHGDGIDQDLAELGYAIATDGKRQGAGDRQDRGNTNVSPHCRRQVGICRGLYRWCLFVGSRPYHTRATRVRPNRPAGLKIRTPMMISRATVSLS